jgi:hypothetical protein
MPSTITLGTTIEIASRFLYNAPLLYTNSGALAYSIGDRVRQFILSPPFAWRWNRAELAPITCTPGQTDYTVNIPDFGWLERAMVNFPPAGGSSANIITATRSANQVTLTMDVNPTTLGFSGGQTITVANVTDQSFDGYQAFQLISLTSNSVTYAQTGTNAVSTGGTISNYSQNIPTPVQSKELTIKTSLTKETVLGQPAFISVINDDNNGNITFRLMGNPDQPYSLYIIYQKAAPSFGAVTDVWDPIPDYMSFIINQGVLAIAYEYKGDERFAYAHVEFLKSVVAANDGLTETQKNIFLGPHLDYQREMQGVSQTGTIARQGRAGM